MRAVVWGGWMVTVVFVMTAATAAAAGSGPRKLRADPLSALVRKYPFAETLCAPVLRKICVLFVLAPMMIGSITLVCYAQVLMRLDKEQ